MKKAFVIAGFAGIGKTTLANKYDNIIDLDVIDYKWSYENVDDIEQKKGNNKRIRNEAWPNNYLQAIRQNMANYDIVFISTDNEILKILDQNNIPYTLVFPNLDCKSEYLERYRKRGNPESFIKKADEIFETLILSLKNKDCKKIILNKDENLESKIKEILHIKYCEETER